MNKQLLRSLRRALLRRQRLSMLQHLFDWKAYFHRIGDSWRSAVPSQDDGYRELALARCAKNTKAEEATAAAALKAEHG
ncbi:hypothetical protein CNMCM5623_001949 [Aspergillus felis]|uniref:Uncharacterized protein n=1 Tax=Aspergillus felis TaxID=1287682 RepID=A0A8H6R275_9EURO|nr:hypothetical protein CNMCM5623_001949 [Aspergillus felis]KAF7182317.1 hypothetical protein CNMCM7691_001797 [Aspergillus felis]